MIMVMQTVEDDIDYDDDNVEMTLTMMKTRMGRYPKEGSDTPRALEGQIFSTLFSIAAWCHRHESHRDEV